jgi:hypothetical protein
MTSRLVALALTSMVVGCSMGGGDGVPVAEDAVFTVTGPGPSAEHVASLDGLLAMLPYEPALPTSLPADVQLLAAQVNLPDPRIDEAARPFNTHLTLSFGPGDGSGFTMAEQGAGVNPVRVVDAGVVPVEIPGAIAAQLLDLRRAGRSFTSVWFRACGLDMQLTTVGPDVLPREEVLGGLARSFIEGCSS